MERNEFIAVPCGPVSTSYSNLIAELKSKNEELISFYVSETKAILSNDICKALNDIEVKIIDYPLYGWCDTYTIHDFKEDIYPLIDELQKLYQVIDNSDLRGLLGCLLELLMSLMHILEDIFFQEHSGSDQFVVPKNVTGRISEILDIIEQLEKSGIEIPKRIKDLLDKLKKILKPIRVAPINNLLGVFYPRDYRIELSKPNIESWISTGIDFNEKLLDVYSHELFHAFHFKYVTSLSYWVSIDKIVKESLARYIEFRYCMKYIGTPEVICNHMQSWNNNDMYDFPYSGAKYLNKIENLCETVFQLSICDKQCALSVIEKFHKTDPMASVTLVSVEFTPGGQRYDYICNDTTVRVGDMVEVPGRYSGVVPLNVVDVKIIRKNKLTIKYKTAKKL